ncbi:MAG: MptD family putative ECF transporter S component [Bacteroidales bacterium]|nr:MptD family putative ECF transporter S component [Bacteroidales bacterium]
MKQIVNTWKIIGVAMLYVLTLYFSAFLGFLAPLGWVCFPVVAAFLGAFSYFWIAVRWQKFGVGSLLALVFSAYLLQSGEGSWAEACVMMTAGILSDCIRRFIGNHKKKGALYAYPALALGAFSWILRLWTDTQWYYDAAIDEMGIDYANGLMLFAKWWIFLLLLAIAAVAGLVGIGLSQKWMRVVFAE